MAMTYLGPYTGAHIILYCMRLWFGVCDTTARPVLPVVIFIH